MYDRLSCFSNLERASSSAQQEDGEMLLVGAHSLRCSPILTYARKRGKFSKMDFTMISVKKMGKCGQISYLPLT